MAECNAVRECFPELLVEVLEPPVRESAHRHIETCADCRKEWFDVQRTWSIMGELPDLPLPGRSKARYLAHLAEFDTVKASRVIPFRKRTTFKWLAQAAAVAVVVGGTFWAGGEYRGAPATTAEQVSAKGIVPLRFSLAEHRTLSSSELSPEIEGAPQIANVQFENNEGSNDPVRVSFDVTSHVTVTGRPDDKSLVNLASHLLRNQSHPTLGRSRTLEWVRDTYSDRGTADPAIVNALASVLRTDTHEGVRIKAVETLQSLPPSLAKEARSALIEALQNDPNPSVRIKAVEALARLARSGGVLDTEAVETLRKKAAQDDENPYVRVKAAEALGQIDL